MRVHARRRARLTTRRAARALSRIITRRPANASWQAITPACAGQLARSVIPCEEACPVTLDEPEHKSQHALAFARARHACANARTRWSHALRRVPTSIQTSRRQDMSIVPQPPTLFSSFPHFCSTDAHPVPSVRTKRHNPHRLRPQSPPRHIQQQTPTTPDQTRVQSQKTIVPVPSNVPDLPIPDPSGWPAHARQMRSGIATSVFFFTYLFT